MSNDIAGGTQFILQLMLESSEGYSSIENYVLSVGIATVEDPMGPDQYDIIFMIQEIWIMI